MPSRILLILAVLGTQTAGAQIVTPRTYNLRNGSTSSYFYEAGPFGFFPFEFIKENHIDSACVQSLNCSNGKTTHKVGGQSEIIYDTSGAAIKRTYYRDGKMRYNYRYGTTELPGRGWAYCTNAWNKRYRLIYSSIHHYDTLHHVDSFWLKSSDKKPFHLSFLRLRNAQQRVLSTISYTQKGEDRKTVYTYAEGGNKLETMSVFKRKKLIRFTDYRCTTQADTMKIHVLNVCERTDKDPMGNIIEIKEEKIGKQSYVFRYKYSPDKKRLLEVISSKKQNKISYRVTYAYDEQDRVTEIEIFYRGKTVPRMVKKYFYANDLSARSESYKKGKLTQMTIYTLTRRQAN